MFSFISNYLNMAKILAVIAVISVVYFSIHAYGTQCRKEGRNEIQEKWDEDKAERKAAADKQAEKVVKDNERTQNALIQTQNNLRVAANQRDAALKRLRELPALLRGEGMLMAGSGGKTMPEMADHTSGTGLTIERRIGGCRYSSTDPCYISRDFFEQAIKSIQDRGFTREWVVNMDIRIE